MDYNIPEIKAALQFAAKAHAGQLRAIGSDLGKPYFDTHVLRVVAAVPVWARAAAALHDVLEDTDTRSADLVDAGTFCPETLSAVHLLTRHPRQSYADYIARLVESVHTSQHRIARAVKLADLADNLATMPDNNSLRDRYIKALAQIAAAMQPGD